MSTSQNVEHIYRRFLAEEGRLERELADLQRELSELEEELNDAQTLRKNTEMLLRAHGHFPGDSVDLEAMPAPRAATKAASRAAEPASAEPAPKKRRGRPPKKKVEATSESTTSTGVTRRKGRRKATELTAGADGQIDYSQLGIVDAAIALAKAKGVEAADAGQVLEWFEEVNYTTGPRGSGPNAKRKMPSRNSVYVSLNRENQLAEDKKRPARVKRIKGKPGIFHFM